VNPADLRHCPVCGDTVARVVPPGDDRERHVCGTCGSVHYQNPRAVVGCFVLDGDGRLLLCRRAIEPAIGRWSVPAGYLELGEGAAAGAARETYEESGARVEAHAPHSRLDLPHIGQFYELYRARLLGPLEPHGPESDAVAWFERGDLPWDALAFPVVAWGLRLFLRDLDAGRFHVHHGVLTWDGRGDRLAERSYRLEQHLKVPLG